MDERHIKAMADLASAAERAAERVESALARLSPPANMPVVVCHDMRQVKAAGGTQFVEIRITAEAVGDAKPWPRNVPAGLGERIADLVREACGDGNGRPWT